MNLRAAFTLLEMIVAIAICALVLTIAIPSINGLNREKRLKQTFDDFDAFVQETRAEGMMRRTDFLLSLDDAGVTALEQDVEGAAGVSDPRHFVPSAGVLRLLRPAALIKDPPPEWMLWKSGVCEPVEVTYAGPAGSWRARYDSLTGHGSLLAEDLK